MSMIALRIFGNSEYNLNTRACGASISVAAIEAEGRDGRPKIDDLLATEPHTRDLRNCPVAPPISWDWIRNSRSRMSHVQFRVELPVKEGPS